MARRYGEIFYGYPAMGGSIKQFEVVEKDMARDHSWYVLYEGTEYPVPTVLNPLFQHLPPGQDTRIFPTPICGEWRFLPRQEQKTGLRGGGKSNVVTQLHWDNSLINRVLFSMAAFLASNARSSTKDIYFSETM